MEDASSAAGFEVLTSTDCTHMDTVAEKAPAHLTKADMKCDAPGCDSTGVCICFHCHAVLCGRGANGHMLQHTAALSSHTIVLSYADLGVWCYGCDCFLDFFHLPALHKTFDYMHRLKFGEPASFPDAAPPHGVAVAGGDGAPTAHGAGSGGGGGSGAAAPGAADTTAGTAATAAAAAAELEALLSTVSPKVLQLVDRIKGLVYGNCIGDAVGLSTEFMDKRTAAAAYGDKLKDSTYEYKDIVKDGHRRRWATGDWTDDSDQMLCIMQGLNASADLSPSSADFGKRVIGWMQHGFPELGDHGGMGIGYTVLNVLRHPLFQRDPHAAAAEVWQRSGCFLAANGAVMRTSILGVPHFYDADRVEADTLEIALTTHADPRSTASCVAVTHAIAAMLRGESLDADALTAEALKRGEKHLTALDPPSTRPGAYERDNAVKEFREHLQAPSFEALELDDSAKIGYTYKCAGSAFVALRDPRPFREVMCDLVKEAGDADTNAAVAGALLGCKVGYAALPASWRDTMPDQHFLDRHLHAFLLKLIPSLPAEYR